MVDQTGTLAGMKRHDYLPFGEEIGAGVGGRTNGQGYVQDNVRQKFTGSERDTETGLDFMQARYYGSTIGRFTSVDPLMASGRLATPQSWNRYAYVLNNPVRLVDPTGYIDEDPQTQKSKPPPPPRNIYVFVGFKPSEQQVTVPGDRSKGVPTITVTTPPIADAPRGTNVQVLQGEAATVGAFTNALKDPNAAGVFFIGHATGEEDANGVFQAGGLKLADGELPSTGVEVQAKTVGIFACDSDGVRGSFTLSGQNQSLITVNSGADGYTSTPALSRAGVTAANAIIGGRSPDAAVRAANQAVVPTTNRTTRGGNPIVFVPDRMDRSDRVRR